MGPRPEVSLGGDGSPDSGHSNHTDHCLGGGGERMGETHLLEGGSPPGEPGVPPQSRALGNGLLRACAPREAAVVARRFGRWRSSADHLPGHAESHAARVTRPALSFCSRGRAPLP